MMPVQTQPSGSKHYGNFLRNVLIILLVVIVWASFWSVYENIVIESIAHWKWKNLIIFGIGVLAVVFVFLLASHHYFQQAII